MPLFKVGEIVRVAARTWPGMNKQGGVGKVINVNDDAGTVDVKYVLGGRERKIEFKFVNTNAFGDSCNAGIGDGTFETAEEKEFSKRILEVKNERKSDKDHSPLRIYSEGILVRSSKFAAGFSLLFILTLKANLFASCIYFAFNSKYTHFYCC
mmetsp:Transcript_15892/g.35799  ORF Transcript_15892/g.35799 Transcript_15892/m.35799 type:complete len:153 (+) Transcript_15892:158-616(+)